MEHRLDEYLAQQDLLAAMEEPVFEVRITNLMTGEVVYLEACNDMAEILKAIEDWVDVPQGEVDF